MAEITIKDITEDNIMTVQVQMTGLEYQRWKMINDREDLIKDMAEELKQRTVVSTEMFGHICPRCEARPKWIDDDEMEIIPADDHAVDCQIAMLLRRVEAMFPND